MKKMGLKGAPCPKYTPVVGAALMAQIHNFSLQNEIKYKIFAFPLFIIFSVIFFRGNSPAGEHLKRLFLQEDVSGAWRQTLKRFLEL
ncbi:MAG: hypothetical protein CM1200mP30_30350 [Pseudomonadota bacterium]|nr:MAG: hypothetical protein CM1200mP30_30350 [Pseudomonadota bacterium]